MKRTDLTLVVASAALLTLLVAAPLVFYGTFWGPTEFALFVRAVGYGGSGHFEVRSGTVRVLSIKYAPSERAWNVTLRCEGRAVYLNYTSPWEPYLVVLLWRHLSEGPFSISARPLRN